MNSAITYISENLYLIIGGTLAAFCFFMAGRFSKKPKVGRTYSNAGAWLTKAQIMQSDLVNRTFKIHKMQSLFGLGTTYDNHHLLFVHFTGDPPHVERTIVLPADVVDDIEKINGGHLYRFNVERGLLKDIVSVELLPNGVVA